VNEWSDFATAFGEASKRRREVDIAQILALYPVRIIDALCTHPAALHVWRKLGLDIVLTRDYAHLFAAAREHTPRLK
jgi:hypothetical protein